MTTRTGACAGSGVVKAVGASAAGLLAVGLVAAVGIGNPNLATAAGRPKPAPAIVAESPGSRGAGPASKGVRRAGPGYRPGQSEAAVAPSPPARQPAETAKLVSTPVIVRSQPAVPSTPVQVSRPAPPKPAPAKASQPAPSRPAPTSAPGPAPAAPPQQGSAPKPVNRDPSQSEPASADFYSNCFGSSYNQSACDQSALSNIDRALANEGYGPLSLPSNYSSLSMAAQLIAVANAERTIRGLPAMPENSSLDARAYQGAQAGADPTGPSGYAWGSNLATGYPTALSADYVWMYDDGTNSPNVDCQSAGQSGCWGHRHNILIQGSGQAGAAIYDDNGTVNLTELFVVNY